MSNRRVPSSLTLLSVVALGCLGDPAGPGGRILVQVLDVPSDTSLVGSPGRVLPFPLRFRAVDVDGRPIAGASVEWLVGGTNGHVTEAAATSGSDGSFQAGWVLGTKAADTQTVTASVRTSHATGRAVVVARAIPSEVARLVVPVETLTVRLGDTLEVPVVATDPFGNQFAPTEVDLEVLDTTIALPDSGHVLTAASRGYTSVVVRTQGVADTAILHVIQVVGEIIPSADSLMFTALGDSVALNVQLLDDRGLPVKDSSSAAAVDDTTVAALDRGGRLIVRSVGNGATILRLEAGPQTRQVSLVVDQVPDRIVASLATTDAIVDLPLNAIIPVACVARDRNSYPIPKAPTVEPSVGGRWTGTRCDSLRIARSGFDTLHLVIGSIRATLPLILAVRPQLGSVQPLVLDSFPADVVPWAPSARRSSTGEIEVYFDGTHLSPDSLGLFRGDLHRLRSPDGIHFHYDGVVLKHADDPCDPQGTAIENISVVPRADGPGWRMFYAAGSNSCYGWQVFSAVSADERTWTKEPGVRLSNGGTLPPDSATTPPWPAGEGMVTDQLPDGTWRMFVSTYEHVIPIENKFQILEWRSPDQIAWSPLRTLISTRDLPPEGQRSVYSPTIREFSSGLWRMVFSADDLNVGGSSRLWSAVSTDLVGWQVEGEILGEAGVNYYYCALVDEQLYTVVAPEDPNGLFTTLVTLTVAMP